MDAQDLPFTDQARIARNQAIISTLERTMPFVTSASSLEEVLAEILDICAEGMGHLYPTVLSLEACGDTLLGRVFWSQRTWESLRRAVESTEVPIDSILGKQVEHRASRTRAAESASVPRHGFVFRLKDAEHPVARTFREQSPRVTTRFHDLVRKRFHAGAAAAAQRALGVGSIALLPLLAAERCLGVLVIASPPAHPLSDLDLSALKLCAAQTAMVIENARLRQDLRDQERQLKRLFRSTVNAQEEERERICMGIHDGVTQNLTSISHYLQTVEGRPELTGDSRLLIGKALTLLRQATREAREVVATLRPPALDVVGLVATLRVEMDQLQAEKGWLLQFDADQVRFPKTVETALYRILHEAIENVNRHAQAQQVWISIKEDHGHVIAVVRDDGVGFDALALERELFRRAAGLLSMRRRVELLQGSFQVVSQPGEGTRVYVEVPVLG